MPDVAPPVENPAPVQEVALVLFHVRADVPPETIEAGLAVRLAAGSGALLLAPISRIAAWSVILSVTLDTLFQAVFGVADVSGSY